MRNASLFAQPIVRLFREISDAPVTKKFRRDTFRRRFVSDMLGAVFTKLRVGTLAIGFGPGATGTVETRLLIELQ
jgi:hypothetical protein